MIRPALAGVVCLLALALAPVAAEAAVSIQSFNVSRTDSQAGVHPDLSASFTLAGSSGAATVKTARIGTPAGLFINPSAVPRCGNITFTAFECPPSTQVGLITIRADYAGDPSHLLGTAPVYALAPAGAPARLGFVLPIVKQPVEVPVTMRTASDYGFDFTIQDFPAAEPLTAASMTLWGVPADPTHNSQRFEMGSTASPAGCPETEGTSCITTPVALALQRVPLLQNPTSCQGPVISTLEVETQQPGGVVSANTSAAATSGCQHVAFLPQLLAGLGTAETKTGTGLSLHVGLYLNNNPDGIASGEVRDLSLALPAGMRVNDTAAAASTCTDAQFGLGTGTPVTCPAGAKVGTLELALMGFDAPLQGDAYFGTPDPDGSYRLFLTATGSGVGVKLAGRLQPGNAAGPVTLAFADLPQLPLSDLQLNLAQEPGLLVTPARCGTYEATGTLVPWSSANGTNTINAITLNSVGPNAGPCPGPASAVELSLSPPSILADGHSTSIATASVSDKDAIAVNGDDLVFSSSDPGQRVGSVTDNGDGTYTAVIKASTSVGSATITATDTSGLASASGTALLSQVSPRTEPASLAPPMPSLSPPPTRRPMVRFISKPTTKTMDRTPTFRFISVPAGSSFRCKLDKRRSHRCNSPLTLPKLDYGPHTFSLRASDGAGRSSRPATYTFMVRKP